LKVGSERYYFVKELDKFGYIEGRQENYTLRLTYGEAPILAREKVMTKITRLYLFVLLLSMLISIQPASAAGSGNTLGENQVLCLPGIYPSDPEDCQPLGPSEYLGRMAEDGITLPLAPLPATHPDPNLPYSGYYYIRLNKSQVSPVYLSLADAIAKTNPSRYIAGGDLRYASYIDEAYVNDRPKPDFFQLSSGEWISASEVLERWRGVNTFQGLEFTQTPPNDFGFVNALSADAETKLSPGNQKDDYTGKILPQYSVVQVYAQEKIGEIEWAMIGPDEWVEGRFLGIITPATTSPEGITNGRWIEVNLYEQTVSAYENNQLVYATLAASGLKPFYTRPGLFQIYKKLQSTTMQGSFEADRSDFYYLEDVPWTMYYDKSRALHGAYWRTRLGFPQSHGCVNLSPGDAQWLFNWAVEGDWVYVWDPSGKTPTDPDFYDDGGA
jgi:hypothetical protein